MLNAEKYRDELLKICSEDKGFAVNKYTNEIVKCSDITDCVECALSLGGGRCMTNTMMWLLSEYKEPIRLTQDEYNFLYLLGDGYLARSAITKSFSLTESLSFYKDKPYRDNGIWRGQTTFDVDIFNRLKNDSFKFIKADDEEPYKVEEILNNCVIVEEKSQEKIKRANEVSHKLFDFGKDK